MVSDMDRRGWHINKGIDAIHILTTIALFVGAFWYFADQDKRINNLELNYEHMREMRSQDQDRAQRMNDELKTDLRIINSKLDRLIEGDD